MTDDISNQNSKRHPGSLLLGVITIGFCLWFCTITVYSVFDSLFVSMGGLLMLTLAPFALFFALGLIRFLSYADNEHEAWSISATLLSGIALYTSGLSVACLEGYFFPSEVEFRSLNLDGYKHLSMMIFFPLLMIGSFCLIKRLERSRGNSASEHRTVRPFGEFVRLHVLKDFFVTFLLYIVLTLCAFTLLAFDPPRPVFEEHLSYEQFYRKDEFPAAGTDFRYFRTPSSFYCDFSLSEQGFLDWAQTRHDWDCAKISANHSIEVRAGHPTATSFQVTDGLTAKRQDEHRGRTSEQAVFDRMTDRVYYSFLTP